MPSQFVARRLGVFAFTALAACSNPAAGTLDVAESRALVPPDDSAFAPLTCGTGPAVDVAGDTNGGATGRDVVGDAAAPAVLRASTAGTVYLRMRLDSTPLQSEGNLASFGWGYEFDSDGDVTSYEKVFIANGVGSDQMDWWDNTTQGTPDDPADTPEVLLETYAPAVDFWAVTPADSSFGGDPDFFLTIAVQQSDLDTYGISFACTAEIWAGSSNSGQRIDNDLVCHDGNASPYSLSAAWIGQPEDPLGIADYDLDGLTTAQETSAGSDACDPDTDDDGLRDGPDGANDTDGDGLADAIDPDSDGDGLNDGLEAGVTIWSALPGTNVTSPSFRSDSDPSSVTDPDDPDSDDDGLLDGEEDQNASGSVDPAESDPADFDTDDGGVGDGAEVDRGTHVRNPRDDFHVAGSGGCAVAPSGSSALAPLVLLALAAVACLSRRRRSGVAALLGTLLLAAAPDASAQVPTERDFDAQRFQPSPGFHDVLGVTSPRNAGHLLWRAAVWGNHASRPFRLVDPSDGSTERAIIADQTALDVAASIGLLDRWELGFVLPMTVARIGDEERVGPPGALPAPGYSGLADLRVVPKAMLHRSDTLAFGAAVPFTLPTSTKDDFLGSRTPSASPRLLGEWRGPRARAIGNAGLVFREEREFVNLKVGNALTFGVAAEVPLRSFTIDAALHGETALRGAGTVETPVEAAAGVTWHTYDGFSISAGGARGLTDGYGTPSWRAYAMVGYAPSRRRARAPREPRAPLLVEMKEGRLVLSQTIDFAVDDDRIEPHSFPILQKVAVYLKDNRWIRRVRIEGHTDNQGGAQYNLNLSQLRAISITRFLVRNGVEPDVLEAKGYGLTQPIATNATPEGRAKNRRVEFVILEIDEALAPDWAKAAFRPGSMPVPAPESGTRTPAPQPSPSATPSPAPSPAP